MMFLVFFITFNKKNMLNYWKLKKENQIIGIDDKMIYKGNLSDTKNIKKIDSETLKNFFSIPFTYIRKIENPTNRNRFTIFFNDDSEEEFIFSDEKTKMEVFNFIKNNSSLFYSSKTPSKFSFARPQLFALIIVSILYFWSLYLAIEIENGAVYQIIGGGSGGIAAFILILANLGSLQLTIAYLILLGIMFFSISKKLKSRTIIEYLKK